MALNVIKYYLTKNPCYTTNRTCTKIGIQLHTIGTGQGTAQSVADYWNQSSIQACTHYVVDCDTAGKVLQLLPETTRSWADAGYGNNNLITFEICESDYIKYTSGANYTVSNEANFKADIMRGYNTAVLLCAKICKERGWNPQTKLASGLYLISSHDEGRRAGLSSAHVDPTHVWDRFGLTMDQFRKDVKNAMSGTTTTTSSTTSSSTSATSTSTTSSTMYRVGTSWSNGKCMNQHGAFSSLSNAKNDATAAAKEKKKTYYVFDTSGTKVYTATYSASSSASSSSTTSTSTSSYSVKVTATDLNIRSGAGLSYSVVGQCPKGVYGITQEKAADGYTWGKLKSGAGWIALEYTTRV